MRGRMTGLAGIATGIALLAAGCGGTSTSASSGASTDGAGVAPAAAAAYVSIDTDLSSGQWDAANALLDKFPGKQKFLTQIRTSFEKDAKVSWANDVKPALGDEVDVVFLGFKSTQVVAYTQPADDAKFDALIKKLNAQETDPTQKSVVGEYKGWRLFADDQSALDAFKKQADAGVLGDAAAFKDAMGSLSGDALVTAYANGPKVSGAVKQAFPSGATPTANQGKFLWGVAELVAEDDGLRLDGRIRSEGSKTQLQPYKAALLDEVPAGALLYASFNFDGLGDQANLRKQFEQGFQGAAGAVPGVSQLLPLLEQLGGVFAHENAIYVRPGALIPEVTLIARPDTPADGVATVDKLISQLAALAGAPLVPKPVTIGTTQAKVVDLGPVAIYYGAQGKDFIVTNQQQAFQDVKAGGSKLADDATFKEARDAASLPDETNGFLYVNLKDSIPAIEGLMKLGGSTIPPDVSANLRPLRTFVAWGKGTGNDASFTAFLEVK